MAKFWTTGDTISEDKFRASTQLPALLGGAPTFQQVDAALATIKHAVRVSIDGTNLPASAIDVHVMAKVDAGTGQVQLFNLTTVALVGSPVSVTPTTDTLIKLENLTLATGVNEYELQANRGTTWITVWGARMLGSTS